VAHISGELVAKAVVLQDDDGYVLAAVPSTHRVELDALGRALDRSVNLATESEISELFEDCAVGAIPPIGNAYGLEILLDVSLTALSDVYFEAGDHRSLVHMSGTDFAFLMIDAQRGTFSHHV
jgi:Ala-tRNA(Pro) deacylase